MPNKKTHPVSLDSAVLYLLRDGGLLKFGVTSDLKTRLHGYSSPDVLRQHKFQSRDIAEIAEQTLVRVSDDLGITSQGREWVEDCDFAVEVFDRIVSDFDFKTSDSSQHPFERHMR